MNATQISIRACVLTMVLSTAAALASSPEDHSYKPPRAKAVDPAVQANIDALNAGALPVPLESDPVPADGDNVTIRLAAVYSERLAAQYESEAELIQVIRDNVEFLNEALAGTVLRTRVVLVSVAKIALSAASGSPSDFEARAIISGDFGPNAPRQRAFADLVATFDVYRDEEAFGIRGLGAQLGTGYSRAEFGYSYNRLTPGIPSNRVFSHEIGHNFGLGHEKTAPLSGVYSFSHAAPCGRSIVGLPLFDLMASNGGTHNFFSSPLLFVGGEPCGLEGADGIDARTTIMKTARVIANLRDDPPNPARVTLTAPATVPEAASTLMVTATRNGGDTSGPASFELFTVPSGDAVRGADFAVPETQTITFSAGQLSKDIPVQILDGVTLRENPGLMLIPRLGTNVDATSDALVRVSIIDNDLMKGRARIRQSVSATTTGLVTFNVDRVGGSDRTIAVTARSFNLDSCINSGRTFDQVLTFQNGEVNKTFEIPINCLPPVGTIRIIQFALEGDQVDPSGSEFTLTVTNPGTAPPASSSSGGGALGYGFCLFLALVALMRRQLVGYAPVPCP